MLKLGAQALHVQKHITKVTHFVLNIHNLSIKSSPAFSNVKKTQYEVLTFLRTCSNTHYEVITSFVPFRSNQLHYYGFLEDVQVNCMTLGKLGHGWCQIW